jgi:hypothetical protein
MVMVPPSSGKHKKGGHYASSLMSLFIDVPNPCAATSLLCPTSEEHAMCFLVDSMARPRLWQGTEEWRLLCASGFHGEVFKNHQPRSAFIVVAMMHSASQLGSRCHGLLPLIPNSTK